MLAIQQLGLRDYAEVWELQKQQLAQRIENQIPDQLLLVEHWPVITCGRRFKPEHLLQPPEVPLYHVERGGDISFHEPGQLTAYPIIRLSGRGRDIHRFLRLLEQVLITTLAECGVPARQHPDPDHTGVWVENRKIASIGIAVRRWVTWHGFALNINNPLNLTQKLKPCGFSGTIMTTLQQETNQDWQVSELETMLVSHFRTALTHYPTD